MIKETKGRLIGYDPVRMKIGLALILIARQYPNLLGAILETIQNALDAGATHIWVSVNQRARIVTVRDNGEGRNRTEFREALMSVLESRKNSRQLGRFGMGLIAPLDKCEKYTFTTTKDGRGYIEWEFVERKVAKMNDVDIPCRDRNDLVFNLPTPPHGTTSIPWKTEVRMENYSTDRVISRLTSDSLQEEILAKFSVTMKRLGAIVSIRFQDESGKKERVMDIQAEPYTGDKLDEMIVQDLDAGQVIFRLYLAKVTPKGRHGIVKLGEVGNDYRIHAATFLNAAGEWVHKEVIQALTSQFFEGEILGEKIRIHPGRKSFQMDNAVIGFCAALDEWYRRVGNHVYQELKEAKREQRYQELSRKVLRKIEELLSGEGLKHLQNVLASFRKGSEGSGHTESDADDIAGEQATPSQSTRGGEEHNGHRGKHPERKQPETELPGHHPYTAMGKEGHKRLLVKSKSLGLSILSDDSLTRVTPWILDTEYGILRVNIRYELFVRCDEAGDEALSRYLEYIALQALVLHSLPPDWMDKASKIADEMLAAHVFMFTPGK